MFERSNRRAFDNFAIETLQAIRPAQIAKASGSFFASTSYARVFILTNATLAAVTTDLWNTLDSSLTTQDTLQFSVKELARLLSVAQLNYLAEGRVFYYYLDQLEKATTLVQGIQRLPASQRSEVFTFDPKDRTDQSRWSFIHLLALDCSLAGLPGKMASWLPNLGTSPSLPFTGLRPECFNLAFPTPQSIALVDGRLLGQLQPQIILSLSADYMNSIKEFSLLNQNSFTSIRPEVIGQLTLATWKRIPSIFIQKMNCDQCRAINQDMVVQLRNSEKSTGGTLYVSFEIAMKPCGVYPSESDSMPLIVGVSVGGGVFLILIVAFLVARYIKAKRSLEYAPLIQN